MQDKINFNVHFQMNVGLRIGTESSNSSVPTTFISHCHSLAPHPHSLQHSFCTPAWHIHLVSPVTLTSLPYTLPSVFKPQSVTHSLARCQIAPTLHARLSSAYFLTELLPPTQPAPVYPASPTPGEPTSPFVLSLFCLLFRSFNKRSKSRVECIWVQTNRYAHNTQSPL